MARVDCAILARKWKPHLVSPRLRKFGADHGSVGRGRRFSFQTMD